MHKNELIKANIYIHKSSINDEGKKKNKQMSGFQLWVMTQKMIYSSQRQQRKTTLNKMLITIKSSLVMKAKIKRRDNKKLLICKHVTFSIHQIAYDIKKHSNKSTIE